MPTLAAFEALTRWSFNGYVFPVRSWRVKGGVRRKLHEYPHAPGAAIEKLGRKPYEFEIEAIFDARIVKYNSSLQPNLWPATLATLRTFWEGEGSYDLNIPTIGVVNAFCDEWEEIGSSRRLSGVDVRMKYIEDASDDFLIDKLITTVAANTPNLVTVLVVEAEKQGLPMGFFASIQALADQILAVGDQVEAHADLIAARAEGIASLCQAADSQLTQLTDPAHYRVGEALRDVWASAIKLNQDVLQKAVPLTSFTVPVPMGIVEVANAVYGDASRALQILKLNGIEDPLAIPPGTRLRVYAQ